MALLAPATRPAAQRSDISKDAQFGATTGVTLTASGTPHALPASPTQLVAATDIEAEWLELQVHGIHQSATLTDALLNIYIGGAGSEVLLIDSLSVGWCSVVATGGSPN